MGILQETLLLAKAYTLRIEEGYSNETPSLFSL
jgi:hypothetical protein